MGKPSYRLFPSVEPTPPTSPQSLQKNTLQRASDYRKKRSISLDDTVRPHASRHHVHKPSTMKTGQRVQIPESSQMSTVQESPLDSPTIPIRYSVISKISDEQHYRSSSAPGEYIRDSQTLPAAKLSWSSKQAESHPLSSPKGLGLSIPISRLADVSTTPQGSGKPKPDLSLNTNYGDKPPPPPPKSPRHSRSSSVQSGVSSMHGESPSSTTIPTPGSIMEAALVDAQSSPVRLPPILRHAKQGSFASSIGEVRVREIVLTKDQNGQAKPVVLQPAIELNDETSVGSNHSSSNQSTPVLAHSKQAASVPPADNARSTSESVHTRNLSGKASNGQDPARPDIPQSLKIGSSTPVPMKETKSDSAVPTERTVLKPDSKPLETRTAQKNRPNLDKPMPNLPTSAGGFADHLREVREAEGPEKRRRPRMNPSPPTFPDFPERAPPNAPFAQPPPRPGSPMRKPDRFYSTAPSPSLYNQSNGSQRDLRSPTPDLAMRPRPQSPAMSNIGPRNLGRAPADGYFPMTNQKNIDSRTGLGIRGPAPKDVSQPQSPPTNASELPRFAARTPSITGSASLPKPLQESEKTTTKSNGDSPTPQAAEKPKTPPTNDKAPKSDETSDKESEPPLPPPKEAQKTVPSNATAPTERNGHSRVASETESNTTVDGNGGKATASILSRAHAQARSATPDTIPTTSKSTDATAADFDPVHVLQSISTQVDSLHSRYTYLRGDRIKLSTSISAALREQKPGPDYAHVLLDQHLSLNAINSSMDICFAKLKALDCRKEDAIAALIARTTQKNPAEDAASLASVASSTPALPKESGRSTPEVEPKTLTPALFKLGKLSPFVAPSLSSTGTTPDMAKEVSTVPPLEKRNGKDEAETEKRVTAIRDTHEKEEKKKPVNTPEAPMSPVSAISSLDEESKPLRIRVKGAKAAKLLGLVAQATNGKPGSPDITLPDQPSLEPTGSSDQHAVDVKIQSKFSDDRGAKASPTKTSPTKPPPTKTPPITNQLAAVPKRKPVASPRQGTNDSVSSATTGGSAADEPEAKTPPHSPEQPFGLKSAKRGLVQTIQVFVDDDILDYYNGGGDRR